MVRWELKNKKTGKLYWIGDVEYDLNGKSYDPIQKLKDLGLYTKYIITEVHPLKTIKDPIKIEVTKVKDDKRRTKSTK